MFNYAELISPKASRRRRARSPATAAPAAAPPAAPGRGALEVLKP
jgi:hypothetical protein